MPSQLPRLTVLLLLSCTLPASALMPCLHKGLSEYGKLVEKVVEFSDSPTHRSTVDGYARSHDRKTEDVEAKVAATGRLKCGSNTLTANLVIKGDVILTAGHALIDYRTCRKWADASQCTFTAGRDKPVRIKQILASGNRCPIKGDSDADWLIMKLDRPVTGVEPYKLEEFDARAGVVARPIIAVADFSVDFSQISQPSGKKIFPKHMQDCGIKRVFHKGDPVGVGSNCDGSSGKSGGALLASDLDAHLIVGISVGNPFSKEEEARELKTGIPTRKPYNEDTWHDSGLAIDGKLRMELEKATKGL